MVQPDLHERDGMTCRSCGNEERASEGSPCERCGTFICVICGFRGITVCAACREQAEREHASVEPPASE